MVKKQKILITGADGFIGSHLTEYLLVKGYKVRALALYNSFNNWGWIEDIPRHQNLEIVTGDIRDPYLCKNITKDINVYLDAKTSGGSVNSDLPINIRGKTKRSSLQGKINEGGPQLYLRSSGGSINIEEL